MPGSAPSRLWDWPWPRSWVAAWSRTGSNGWSLDRFSANPGDPAYLLAIAGVPAVMTLVALWLAYNATSSTDSLARLLARSSQVLSALAILGAVMLTIVGLMQR